eukprot:12021469-Heterocapsa_arctica.AAC.1
MKLFIEHGFSLCGKEFQRDKDYTVTNTLGNYRYAMTTRRVSRERAQRSDDPATDAEHRTFQKLLGRLQWAARMALSVSALSSKTARPTIKDIQEANSIMIISM